MPAIKHRYVAATATTANQMEIELRTSVQLTQSESVGRRRRKRQKMQWISFLFFIVCSFARLRRCFVFRCAADGIITIHFMRKNLCDECPVHIQAICRYIIYRYFRSFFWLSDCHCQLADYRRRRRRLTLQRLLSWRWRSTAEWKSEFIHWIVIISFYGENDGDYQPRST